MYHAYVYYLVNSASILDIVERNLSVQGVILCLVLVFVVVDEVLEGTVGDGDKHNQGSCEYHPKLELFAYLPHVRGLFKLLV